MGGVFLLLPSLVLPRVVDLLPDMDRILHGLWWYYDLGEAAGHSPIALPMAMPTHNSSGLVSSAVG